MDKKEILIVEDDPKSLVMTGDLLRVKGYATSVATDGKKGVEMARARKPALILMDIQLPVMSGFEAAKLLKADPATRQIPIIALTAYAMAGDKERAFKAGCDGYITKPIEITEFLAKVAEVLSQ